MGSQCSNPIVCKLHYRHQSPKKFGINHEDLHSNRSTRASIKDLEQFHDLLNQISHHDWIDKEHQLVNSEKFFQDYKEYLRDQSFLHETWEISHPSLTLDESISHHIPERKSLTILDDSHSKTLIRRGVPLDKFRGLVLDIFRKNTDSANLDYECALKVAFADHVPKTFKNVPLFTFSNEIDQVLPVHYLNEEGMMALKRIMWVFEKNIPKLEYCPILSQTVALLLVFMTESETYCVVKEMIERPQESLKWYFTMKKEDYEVFLESMCTYMKERRSGYLPLWTYLQSLTCDCNKLFWELCRTLFLGYLPLHFVLRIFMAYLNEGIKIYYRFCLAILKVFQDDILRCEDPELLLPLLKEKCSKMTKSEVQNLMTTAYTTLHFKSLKRKLPSIHAENFHAPEPKRLYLPVMSSPSKTVKSQEFETIWEWLPEHLKITRPKLKYSSQVHGWSLNTLYSHCCPQDNMEYDGILIIIKTTKNVMFGAFIEGMIESCKTVRVEDKDESFVFQLEPEEVKYDATAKNNIYLICEKEALTVGAGGFGPAIYLVNNMLEGYSFSSETYDNKPLHLDRRDAYSEEKDGNQFESAIIDVYWLIH